jgi:hypothetical protein
MIFPNQREIRDATADVKELRKEFDRILYMLSGGFIRKEGWEICKEENRTTAVWRGHRDHKS